MRVWAVAIGGGLLLVPAAAKAHFRLEAPASNVVQDSLGSPQKPTSATDGCPSGTASGKTSVVRAGGKVTVKITETVPHGGHYRVALGANEAAFSFPASVAENDRCVSTTIANPVALPVLADGLFVHNQTAANARNFCNGTATCETEVTIPATTTPGTYLLQVIEWMLPHASAANNGTYGCFYTHCASLEVVAPDASVPDVTELSGEAGGPPVTSDPADEPASTRRLSSTPTESSGCNVGSANGASLVVPLGLACAAILRRRRRA
jgi:hypothetical protein